MEDKCIMCGADVSDLGTQVCDECRRKIENKEPTINSKKPTKSTLLKFFRRKKQ